PAQTVNLSGISSGASNEVQTLLLTATSSNPGVVPAPTVTYVTPSDTGSLSVAPIPGAAGVAVITVTVSDGSIQNGTFSRTFTVTVNGAPTLSHLTDQSIDEDTSTSALALTIGDGETPAAALTLTAASSDTNLVAVTNIVFGGSASNRTVTVRPSTNQFGH